MNIGKTLGTLLVASLIAPAGLLFSQVNSQPAAADSVLSRTDTISTTTNPQNTFSCVQDLAQSIRKQVAPLKFSINGNNVTWKLHSVRLMRIKNQVNQMETDVNRLETRKSSLPSWQQQLLGNVKQDTHELVYQTSAAIKMLNKHHDTTALATTQYPQYIDMISQKANDAADSIGTVFQRHGVDMD